MNTNKIKVLITVVLTLAIVAMLGTVVFAANTPIDTLMGTESNVDTTGVNAIGKSIINVLSTVGIVVAVVILMVLGIKYMMGSAEEKAEYKKTMIPYLVGAVLIFGASSIANIIYGIATKF